MVQAQETLLTIEPSARQPRNSEGDVIELKDGSLCLIYTRFAGGASDHAAADLAMRVLKMAAGLGATTKSLLLTRTVAM